MLAGDDGSGGLQRVGRERIWVGCVESGPRQEAVGEQGIVSAASSSLSRAAVDARARVEGVRGTELRCRGGGKGDEL